MDTDGRLVHREITDVVLREFLRVYNTLRFGYFEVSYRKALMIALKGAGLRCNSELTFPLYFDNEHVGDYRADLVVESKVIIEVKTLKKIEEVHKVQCFNYMKVARMHVGLVLNFGPSPQIERLFLHDP